MEILINYGSHTFPINIETQNLAGILSLNFPGTSDPLAEIQRAMNKPYKSDTLLEIARKKKPKKTVIVVTDVSRPVPHALIIPEIIRELRTAGLREQQISLVIATGAHRPNSAEEIKKSFGFLGDAIEIVNHDCDKELVSLGSLTEGTELLINKEVASAELLITVGAIMPHNLAGFSGGPKLIMPGVAGRKSIEHNHRMMNNREVGPGKTVHNPIHNQIMEAANLVSVDFILNVVLNHNNEIARAFAGNMEIAWEEGCKFCLKSHQVNIPSPEDVVIAGAGGYPRDSNLYQAVKALVNASKMCKKGGTLVLVARCQEGLGDPHFEKWINSGSVAQVLALFKEKGFQLGGHKAYLLCNLLKDYEVVMLSELPDAKDKIPFFSHADKWCEAEKFIKKRHGNNYRALILPLAGLVFPLSEQCIPSGK